jgi:hypothetical protein
MRRAARLLLLASPIALVAVPVALAGADPAPTGLAPRAANGDAADRAVAREANAARIVQVRRHGRVLLRTRPSGSASVRIGDTTDFGSPQALGVVRRRGHWLGVTTPELPNGRLGWIDGRDRSVRLARTRWSIHVDLSRRLVVLRRDGRAVRRVSVAVGRPGSPTPTGRFAVTDKIPGSRFGPYYGCCILAISATQPNTPPGWTGGNRMAIHGTSDPGSIGSAASAGCLRAKDADLRFLTGRVPLGTPVVIRP